VVTRERAEIYRLALFHALGDQGKKCDRNGLIEGLRFAGPRRHRAQRL
jgi:hypothetical protein